MLADSVAPSDGLPAVEMNAVVELGTAVMARSELQTLRTDLGPFAGHCWWCWKCVLDPAGNRLGEHGHPDGCERRERPDMSDFKQHKPRAGMRSGVNLKVSAKHRPQTTRTKEEQKEHRADYKTARVQRERALLDEAQLRTREWVLSIAAPLRGVGEFGQFTLAQMLTIDFATELNLNLSRETMEKSHKGINSAAAQRLSALLKADKAFPGGIAQLRLPRRAACHRLHFDAWHLKLNAA